MDNLSKRTLKRLNNFPVLKSVIDSFIFFDGNNPMVGRLTDLTVYIRLLDIDEPSLFGWNNYYTEEFYSWGHNSRYGNVLEPLLCFNLNRHVCKLLNYLEENNVKEPDIENE